MTKSKTIATWLALLGGGFGAHRFYLYGSKDWAAWLHPWPTLAGAWGVWRAIQFGQDDRLAWALIPILGLMLAGTMLMAIIYGLTPDEKWAVKFGMGKDSNTSPSGWAAVIGVVLALMMGAGILMATIAYSGQRYFESQIEEAKLLSQ